MALDSSHLQQLSNDKLQLTELKELLNHHYHSRHFIHLCMHVPVFAVVVVVVCVCV